jgi:2-polyprenyl-3-methyl-5-hydroxy-6-metoxy-1,4-benzoquinol methylase
MSVETEPTVECQICGHRSTTPDPREFGRARGNTEAYRTTTFRLWQCPNCRTIYSLDPVDFAEIYRTYPLNTRAFDFFARRTLGNLYRRLRRVGVTPESSVLDYGCGNGLFLRYLERRGFRTLAGYDPYLPEYAVLPQEPATFDCVIANDTIEHCPNARQLVRDCAALVKPGGILYLGTADAEGVDMTNLEPHLMRLHQPYHRLIVTRETLEQLGVECGLTVVSRYRRSYMDTLTPFANYRFLDELNRKLGHNLNAALNPARAQRAVLTSPRLWFFAVFGSFFPSAYEPAVIFRKPH